jgi:hypothetical protein
MEGWRDWGMDGLGQCMYVVRIDRYGRGDGGERELLFELLD